MDPVTFLGCAGKQFVDNVVVANSVFETGGESAILGNMTNLQLLNNTFANNHSYPAPYNDDGGQIDMTPCASSVAMVNNVFRDGSAVVAGQVYSVQGIELHGNDLALVNNTITNNSGLGISIGGASNVFIANWDRNTAITGNQGSGVGLSQGAGSDSLRSVDFITNRVLVGHTREPRRWAPRHNLCRAVRWIDSRRRYRRQGADP